MAGSKNGKLCPLRIDHFSILIISQSLSFLNTTISMSVDEIPSGGTQFEVSGGPIFYSVLFQTEEDSAK